MSAAAEHERCASADGTRRWPSVTGLREPPAPLQTTSPAIGGLCHRISLFPAETNTF